MKGSYKMVKSIKKTIVTLFAALTIVAVPALVTVPVLAANNLDIGNCVAQGTDGDGNLGDTCTGDASAGPTKGTDLTDVIKTVVNIISIIVGVVAVIMIIWGGLKYITSGGESNKITGAKNTIIYALIGLVIVALAQFIVKYVLAKTTEIAN